MSLKRLGFSFLLVALNRLIITTTSFVASGGGLIFELLDFKVFRQAFYASFARYDAGWYALIAQKGYFNEKSSAFFPLYPLLMKGLSALTGLSYKASGQAISILCFIASLWLVQMLSEQPGILGFSFKHKNAGRFIAAIIALNPLSFFYTIPYTESLFLMLVLLFMKATAENKWLLAGIWGFFAGLARNSGVLLSIIFVFEYLRAILPSYNCSGLIKRGRHYLRAFKDLLKGFSLKYFVLYRSFLAILLVPAGTVGYFIYLYFRFGSFAGPIRSQHLFGRSPMFPPLTFYYGLKNALGRIKAIGLLSPHDQSYFLHYYLIQLLSVCFFVIAAIYLINKLPLSYNLFMIASLILPLSQPAYTNVVDFFVSFPRYTITLFPYFAAIYGFLRGSRKALIFYLAASIYLLIVAVSFWSLGRFMA